MMISEKCYLNFKEHSDNIVSTLSQLQKNQDFCDVTLVSDDGQQLGAHKIILCAGSGFFLQLFSNNFNSHSMIYLRGITSYLLDSILTFIYEGKTSVNTENLKDFLVLASELKVKGSENISYSNFEISSKLKLDSSPINQETSVENNAQNQVPNISQQKEHTFAFVDYKENHSEQNFKIKTVTNYETLFEPGKSKIDMKIQEKEKKIKYRIENRVRVKKEKERKYVCNIPNCGYITNRMGNLKNHTYRSHQKRATPILCTSSFCTQVFETRDKFLDHKKTCILKCPWNDCDKEYMALELFEGHKRAHQMGRDMTKKVTKQEPSGDAEERLKGIWNLIKNKGPTQ